jgi:hypothetical protein
MDDDPPTVKPWGIDDKEYLQRLINKGKVDITRADHDYIDRVRQKYFRHRKKGQLPAQFQDLRLLTRA